MLDPVSNHKQKAFIHWEIRCTGVIAVTLCSWTKRYACKNQRNGCKVFECTVFWWVVEACSRLYFVAYISQCWRAARAWSRGHTWSRLTRFYLVNTRISIRLVMYSKIPHNIDGNRSLRTITRTQYDRLWNEKLYTAAPYIDFFNGSERYIEYDFIDFGNGMTQKSIVKCKVGRSLSAVHSVNRFLIEQITISNSFRRSFSFYRRSLLLNISLYRYWYLLDPYNMQISI